MKEPGCEQFEVFQSVVNPDKLTHLNLTAERPDPCSTDPNVWFAAMLIAAGIFIGGYFGAAISLSRGRRMNGASSLRPRRNVFARKPAPPRKCLC